MLACHRCDALQRVPVPKPGQSAFCDCCGARLFRYPRGGLERPLALTVAATVLFVVANLFPLVSLDIGGLNQDATLLGTAVALYQHGEKMVGVLVFLVSIGVPASIMFSTFYVLVAVRHRLRLPGTRRLLVFLSHLHPWEMGDVFLVSILVALVKLAGVAQIIIDAGLYALAGAVLLAIAAQSRIDTWLLWEALDARQPSIRGTARAGQGEAAR